MNTAITQINLELSSICDRKTLCGFCGHQDTKINPQPKGYMPLPLLMVVAQQIPGGAVVQLHKDGDPLAYPDLEAALGILQGHFVSIVTHGEKLEERAQAVIGKCDSVTVSVIPNDPDRDIQLMSVCNFLAVKGVSRPLVQLKAVGVPDEQMEPYRALGVRIIGRSIHPKDGNYRYHRAKPAIPEIGVCLDFLHHPSIDIHGNLYICNRIDPEKKGLIGNLTEHSLMELWMGAKRRKWLDSHMAGRRGEVPLCEKCTYWGIPVQ